MENNINPDLEKHLVEYCSTRDGDLFENYLYKPLMYIAKSICNKKNLSQKKVLQDNLLQDMVSHIAVTLPEYYDKTKGKAKNSAYILMSQWILKYITYNLRDKRNINQTVYLENMEVFDGILEIEVDVFELNKLSILKHKKLFDRLDNKLHYKISKTILDCIEFPEKYKCSYNSYVKDIARKCKTDIDNVYAALKKMHRIISPIINC